MLLCLCGLLCFGLDLGLGLFVGWVFDGLCVFLLGGLGYLGVCYLVLLF